MVECGLIPDIKVIISRKNLEVLTVEVAKDSKTDNMTKYVGDNVKLAIMMHDMIWKIFLASYNKNKISDIKVYGIIISRQIFLFYNKY